MLQRWNVQVTVTKAEGGPLQTIGVYTGQHTIAPSWTIELRGTVNGPFSGADEIARYEDANQKCKADAATKLDQIKATL